MTHEEEIEAIKQATFDKFKGANRVWIVEDYGSGFMVHDWTPEGVAPPMSYPTLRKAASRLLQLFGIGPVAPQTWPEEACVGSITTGTDQ
ncbi:hypothetical protein [Bradyrhizobium sp. LA2.1]|uniref:hypothetical protein n=1 Tax=Bradyrhizobium sp. LA2.1 TaxID=3156376 RepID=UPI00339863B1